MAAIQGVVTIAETALVTATAKTLVQIVAAANHRVRLLGWGIFFDGTGPTNEPVQVRLLRQTTAGTSSDAGAAVVKIDSSADETLQTTARITVTAEPTAGDVLWVGEVHPQGGYEAMFPWGNEIIVPGGTRLGIEATAPAGVNARAYMRWEE
jgi:hypothetical protein